MEVTANHPYRNVGGKTAAQMTDDEVRATIRGFAQHFIHNNTRVGFDTHEDCNDECQSVWEYYDGDVMPVLAEAVARGMIT